MAKEEDKPEPIAISAQDLNVTHPVKLVDASLEKEDEYVRRPAKAKKAKSKTSKKSKAKKVLDVIPENEHSSCTEQQEIIPTQNACDNSLEVVDFSKAREMEKELLSEHEKQKG